MTTTNLTNDACLALLQLHGAQTLLTQQEIPDASGALFVPDPESKALWTDGLPDKQKIKERMEQTLQTYLTLPRIVVPEGHFRHERWIAEAQRRQKLFYAEMHYLDDLLYAAPVLPLPVESTTTIVPYEPPAKRKRGRPSTGGRKPRPTTRKERMKETD